MAKVGRNDPCPCGSGKKYKHCCLRADRARRAASKRAPRRVEPPREGSLQSQAAWLRDLVQESATHIPDDQTQELDRLLDRVEDLAAYEEMEGEIEAASLALEAYRAEFETAIKNDLQGLAERAEALFSEERFARWRWTAADVTEKLESTQTIAAAILHLADSDLRMHLARRLTMLLPEYVAQQRYLDAWLIQYCGFQMLEAPDRSNPFLLEMFRFGYEAWEDQIAAQKGTIIRQFGLDPAQVLDGEMDLADVEAWLREQMADPDKRARLEAYYAEHPMMREQSQAEVWEIESKSVLLLEREDAGPLYLAPDEAQPWLEPLLDRLRPLEARAAQDAEEGRLDDPQIAKEMGRALVEVSQEMAASVFTPQRVQALAETLQAYRQQLQEANEKQAALYAQGGLLLLEEGPSPADNRFLVAVCATSLREMLFAASERAAQQGQEEIEG
jgi:hypothetical protein